MPRVHSCRTKKDRYSRGLKTESEKTKSGFRHDYSKPADENDTVFCPAGEIYFWWQFMHSPKQFSRSYPRGSQLTRSEFLGFVCMIQEEIEDYVLEEENPDHLESEIENWKDQIQEHLDELEEKKSNMESAGLENVPSYELLTERAEALENAVQEFESLNVPDEEADFSEWESLLEEVGQIEIG